MSFVKVGHIEFHVDHLKDRKLDECLAFFKHINPSIVKQAWKVANPKGKAKTKSED